MRSRAYGPDADIDADALERLIELESMVRASAPTVDTADDPASEVRLDRPQRTRASALTAATAVIVDESADDPARSAIIEGQAPARRAWWHQVPLWAYIVVATAIGLVAGLAIPALLTPQPVATLRPAPIGEAPLEFEMYGMQGESQVRYDPFYGLEVWSAVTQQGSMCIVITTGRSEWMGAGCAPEPLNPTADITFVAGMRPVDGLELPDGSIARFVLRGDVIEVWIAETTQTA